MNHRKLSKVEKETIILTSDADDVWQIYTFNTALKKKLKGFAYQYPDCCILKKEDPDIGCATFEIQKARLSIRLTAPYSEERRRNARRSAKESGLGGSRDLSA